MRDYAQLLEQYPFDHALASAYLDTKGWRPRDLAATVHLLQTVQNWREADWPALREDRPPGARDQDGA